MGAGDLAHRVPIRHNNDLGELAGSINTMASDIEQMLDAKRQLLLGASHELRSPLTRAKIATSLLADSKEKLLLEEDLLEMENLVTDILESERMKSGHAALERQPVNLLDLVNSTAKEIAPQNIIVECAVTPPLLQLDENRIRILLRNILSNAVTHSEDKSADIIVTISTTEKLVKLTVSDSGPGIAAEHLEHVTEPFYRTDGSRTRTTGGFGLGLHLASLVAQAHNGELQINSRTEESKKADEQTGTDVSLILPMSPPN